MRGWCSAQGIPKHVTGDKLNAVYAYFNWMYEGFLGALIMRQGYYIANGKNLPAWLKSGRARSTGSRRSRPPSTTSGTTASRLRATFRASQAASATSRRVRSRDGGSFLKRSCKYTSWNSFFTQNVYQVKKFNEFLSAWRMDRGRRSEFLRRGRHPPPPPSVGRASTS